MTTRSTPASSIIGSTRSMVNGSGNCGFAPGSQGQSGEFAFQRCTWASTMVRLAADCGRAGCSLAATAAPAASVAPNSRRVIMLVLAPSSRDCSKRSPDERSDIQTVPDTLAGAAAALAYVREHYAHCYPVCEEEEFITLIGATE